MTCYQCMVRNASLQLLTSKLDPPQDEEDEDGDEDYGDSSTNHHPHHLQRKRRTEVNVVQSQRLHNDKLY